MINKLKNYLAEFIILFKTIPPEVKTTLSLFAQNPVEELKINPESKDLYEKFFSDKTSFEKIIDSACGMYCLKMILKTFQDLNPSIIELVKSCMDYGGYTIEENGRLSAMVYKPFKNFIKAKFNLDSEVCSVLSLRRIKYELSKGNFVITSVHWDIKDAKNTPEFKGGHLVVVTGYDTENIYINNPSGYENITQENYRLSYSDFRKFFAGRGIIIENKPLLGEVSALG